MYKSKCEWCGKEKEYPYKSWIKRFCSYECSAQYKWAKKRERKKYIDMVCPVCNKHFQLYEHDPRLKTQTVFYCSKECFAQASRTGQMVKCKQCGKEFYSTRCCFCSKKCAYDYKKQNYDHKTYLENGYEVRFINGYNKKGNVKEHRYVMEQFLGRRLTEDEVVHHKDGNKLNNNISNLEVMTREEHSRYHRNIRLKNH